MQWIVSAFDRAKNSKEAEKLVDDPDRNISAMDAGIQTNIYHCRVADASLH